MLRALVLFASAPLIASADDDGLRIPKAGQPTQDFYNAAGTGVKVIASAKPIDIARGEWITLTVSITNLVNAPDVQKPSLKALRAFDAFQIDEEAQLDPKFDPSTPSKRVFAYRLRPASEKLTLIPEIAFHYYDPRRVFAPNRPRDQFPKTFSNALTIRVKPPVDPPPAAPTPLDIPPFANTLAGRDEALASPAGNPPMWIWLAALLVPPVLAVGWVVAWRRLYPGAAKLVMLKRNRAVRHALTALAKAKHLPISESAEAVATALLDYLRARFELPLGAFTPAEVAAHLRSTGCPGDRIVPVEALLRACDDRRFAPSPMSAEEFAVDAEQLIIALEEPA